MDCRNCEYYSYKGDNTKGYCSMYKAYYYLEEGRNCNYNTDSVDPDSSSSGFCYVATCVYGSYDCPPVWTLRRYRDYYLKKTIFGRAFIKVYYAVSPKVIKIFGDTKWFKTFWKRVLDRKVKTLNDKGVESTPYKD